MAGGGRKERLGKRTLGRKTKFPNYVVKYKARYVVQFCKLFA